MPARLAPTGSKPSPTPQITGAGPRFYRTRTKLVEPGDPGVVYIDTSSGTVTLTGSTAQSFSHSGSRAGTITVSGVVPNESNNHTGFADSQDRGIAEVTITGSKAQSHSHSASRSVVVTFVPVWGAYPGVFYPGQIYPGELHGPSEDTGHIGSGTIGTTSTGTGFDSYVYTDSRTGTLTLTGTRTNAETHASSRAALHTLTGTASEQHIESGGVVYNDTQPGTIALSGAKSESSVCSRSRSGTVTFTGTGQDPPEPGPTDMVDDLTAVLVPVMM